MNKLIKILYILLIIFFSILLIGYCVFFYVLPLVINSEKVTSKIEKIIKNKTDYNISIHNLKLNPHKNLTMTISAEEISFLEDYDKIANAQNIRIKIIPLSKSISSIEVDKTFINEKGINSFINKNNNKKNSTDTKHILNRINYISINNFNIETEGSILNTKIEIKPKSKTYKIFINGKNIPISKIESVSLKIMKRKNPSKKFIENFKDYSGTADINMTINDIGIYGKCDIHKLSAKTVPFNIPILFNDFTADFNGNTINAEAYGTLGNEKVYATFNLKDYSADKREIYGNVHAELTNPFTEKYMPEFKIDGKIRTNLQYHINQGKIDITYLIKLKEGSNLYYKEASLDLTEKDRRLFVRTQKYKDKLYIKKYDYSLINGKEINNIISGFGLFEKQEGKMKPSYITCKTMEDAPVALTGNFGRKLEGGTFTGDLKYDFYKRLLTGNFNLNNSKFKDFYIDNANIIANKENIIINASGTYLGSKYTGLIDMENRYDNTITIHNIELFIDKYKIKKGRKLKKSKPKNKKYIHPKVNFIVENGKIRVNQLFIKRILIEDIEVIGTLKNKIVKFSMPHAKFAKGTLNASGEYNIQEHSSIIDFSANNVDSDRVCDMFFNLKGQIKGIAAANLHAITENNLEHIKANANFAIDTGYLPKLGSTEFIIKKSIINKKPLRIKLSDIINIDLSKSKALSSDLKGSFDYKNSRLENIKIYSQQKYLSMLIEGSYNIKKENADIQMWGNYNRIQQNKVKILFVPLSWIMKIAFKQENTKELYKHKLNSVPQIIAEESETESFRVNINGNLNNNNIKVELKSIK